jgi:hypothetical protein
MLQLSSVAELADANVWTGCPLPRLDAKLWPFVFLTILWRIWDARNAEVFRSELSSSRRIITRVCDDLVIWQKRLKLDRDVSSGGSCYDLKHKAIDADEEMES